jgi:AraC-like DNA-binding protein
MELEKNSKIREHIFFEPNIPIRIFRSCDHGLADISPHMHEALEIIYISTGELDIIDASIHFKLSSEQFHIFNSNSLHSTHFKGSLLEGIVLQISFSFIQNIVPTANIYSFSENIGDDASQTNVIYFLKKLLKQQNYTSTFGYLESYADLINLLNILFTTFCKSLSTRELRLSQKYYERNLAIRSYIDKNYAEKLTLDQLASNVHLNPSYLSRFISKYYGKSFYGILTDTRLDHAYSLITSTDISITEIIGQTGFANYAQFNKEFKKRYHSSPKNFRMMEHQ